MPEVVIVIAAIAIGAFIKGATGTGLPQIAIPVMAVFVGVEHAVVVMAIPGIIANGALFWRYRGHLAATRDLPVLVAMGMIGAVFGTVALNILDARLLSLALAAVICAYVMLFITRTELVLPARVTRWLSPPVGLAAGLLQGATGISGPLVTTYLHAFRMPLQAFVLAQVVLFQMYSVMQTIVLVQVGLYTPARIAHSLLALIPILLLIPLGARCAVRLSQRTFDALVLLILLGSGVKLLHDALAS